MTLVVLGFILVGLTEGARFGLRAGTAQTDLVQSQGELDVVDRTLRNLFTTADPGKTGDAPPLRGSPATALFRARLPGTESGDVQQIAEIALGVDAQQRLQLRWRPYLHVRRVGQTTDVATEELLSGVERIEFAYWGRDWQRSWDEPSLPSLIRIRLVFPPGDKRHWPDIVVELARKQPL